MPFLWRASVRLRPTNVNGFHYSFVDIAIWSSAILLLFQSTPSLSQQTVGEGKEAGEIIALRDVPMRPAQTVGEPGVPVIVRTDMSVEITDALGLGLVPLTDSETSAILADNKNLIGIGPLVRDALHSGSPETSGMTDGPASGSGMGGMGSSVGATIGSALGQGLGAIGSSMTAVRSALPGGQ